ncbi:MAG: L,D-transpeptidase family protein [Steroidobacteraceae bacterium]
MNIAKRLKIVLPLLATMLAVASCSLLEQPLFGKRRVAKPEPAPVVQALPDPVTTHHFELSDADTDVVGYVQVIKASKEDTLTDIARRFNVGFEDLARANPKVDPWLPGEGREIVIPSQYVLPDAPREGIIINAAAMRLYYFPKAQSGKPQEVYTYPIGIGRVGWKTPEGVTRIVRRKKDPTWTVPSSVRKEHAENGDPLPAVVGAGPDNPLGRHALYLGWPSYLVHGTNKPAGVGLRSSHGCVRLYPEDIAQLFDMAPDGTKVRVVNQPFLFGWHDNQLYLQAYDILEDDPRDWSNAERKLLSKSLAKRIQKQLKARNEEVDWDEVSALAHEPRGIPVAISQTGSDVDKVIAGAIRVANRLPKGANWDGQSDAPMDEKAFKEMFADTEEASDQTAAPAAGGATH